MLPKYVKIKKYKSIILYGYETWLLTLRTQIEGFGNSVLTIISEPKRDKVIG
jgi:hypothetical protein